MAHTSLMRQRPRWRRRATWSSPRRCESRIVVSSSVPPLGPTRIQPPPPPMSTARRSCRIPRRPRGARGRMGSRLKIARRSRANRHRAAHFREVHLGGPGTSSLRRTPAGRARRSRREPQPWRAPRPAPVPCLHRRKLGGAWPWRARRFRRIDEAAVLSRVAARDTGRSPTTTTSAAGGGCSRAGADRQHDEPPGQREITGAVPHVRSPSHRDRNRGGSGCSSCRERARPWRATPRRRRGQRMAPKPQGSSGEIAFFGARIARDPSPRTSKERSRRCTEK